MYCTYKNCGIKYGRDYVNEGRKKLPFSFTYKLTKLISEYICGIEKYSTFEEEEKSLWEVLRQLVGVNAK